MMALVMQVLLIVFGPLFCIWLVKKIRLEQWLSPVILAYGLGILLANFPIIALQINISTTFSEATILFALPLLLFSTDLKAWLSHAPKTLLSFGLCICSGLIASAAIALTVDLESAEGWRVAGMLTGVYTGGTPNMQAIGLALGADENLYVLMNAADIFCGGIYLLFLTSIAHRFAGLFLPSFQGEKGVEQLGQGDLKEHFTWPNVGKSLLLALLIIGASAGLTLLFTGALQSVSLLILLLTTFSIAASFSKKVRNLKGSFEAGEYFLLMFCIAVGMLSDFAHLLDSGTEVIGFTAAVLLSTVALHFLLSALFRIDRDTTLITSTAALYGPVFIGQVASVIGNRTLVFSGMAMGLLGYAIGNYLGIGMGEVLRVLLSE